MKNIIRLIILAAGILLCYSLDTYAQSGSSNTDLNVIKAGQVGDSVVVDMFADIRIPKIGTRERYVFTPVIVGQDREMRLPSIVVDGRIRYKAERRAEALSGNRQEYFQLFRAARKDTRVGTNYRVSVPFESWMRDSRLVLVTDVYNCRNCHRLFRLMVVDNINTLPEPEFTRSFDVKVPFITVPKQTAKRLTESGEAFIIYNVGRSDILTTLGNNRQELQKVTASVDFVRSEPTAKIVGITILSYASPEGTWSSNMKLSERRAHDFMIWFRNHHKIGNNVSVNYIGKGEDWVRLEKMVREDTVLSSYEKERIIAVINSGAGYDQKELLLKEINGGSTYRYLLNNIYPSLRRTEYSIEYTVPEFTIERSRELYRNRPGMLSLTEFYALANEYPRGSDEFVSVFETAARVYPNDAVANLNVAAAMLSAGKNVQARTILERYLNEPQAWIYLGILEAREGNYDLAGGYLERAAGAGIAGADDILREFRSFRSEYDDYQQQLKSWKIYQ